MTELTVGHSHVFLAPGHEHAERRTWAAGWRCGLMMLVEIVGGTIFGSVALVADGLHMSTHAGALLIAAFAYTYARKHAADERFTFGTGKLGDLAGFTSAIILVMIALLIGYEAVSRFFSPVPINFNQAIPIAVLGLGVNVLSAWLLSSGNHHHGHTHGHGHGHGAENHNDEVRQIESSLGALSLEIFEEGVPPRFRLHADGLSMGTLTQSAQKVSVETERPDGVRQTFLFSSQGSYLESVDEIPEPHEFTARLHLPGVGSEEQHEMSFVEHDHGHHSENSKTHRDNNFRAALVHVIGDAAVSVLVIGGLILAKIFGWLWIDPVVGIVGALVIANWAYGLIKDTGAILLDMNADKDIAKAIRVAIESGGDRLADLHLWRLGPGHLGAIVSVATDKAHGEDFYRSKLARFQSLSHLTIEVRSAPHRQVLSSSGINA